MQPGKIQQIWSKLFILRVLCLHIFHIFQILVTHGNDQKEYKDLMQAKVQSNPHSALSLKTTFEKLSSILNTPSIRIIQAGSPDLNSVRKYNSGELVRFVKEVLQIIPIQVFEVLQDIITLITSVLKPLPSKVNKIELKDYVQYEDKTQIAKLKIQFLSLQNQS